MLRLSSFLRTINSWCKTHAIILFIGIVVGGGGYFAVVTPPLMGGDEAAHLFRIMQLADGQLFSDKLSSGHYGGDVPENIDQISRHVLGQVQAERMERTFQPPREYYDLLKQSPSTAKVSVPFTGAALYSPVAYAPMIITTFAARHLGSSIAGMIFAARITNLLTFAALGLLSLWLLKGRKSQWIVAVILLFPMSLFQAGTINGDAILIGMCMLFLSALLRYWHDKHTSKIVVISLIVAAVLTPLVKNVYVFLSLLVPLAFVLHKRWGRHSYIYAFWLTLAISLPILVWGLAVSGANRAIGLVVTDAQSPISPTGQLSFMLHNPHLALGALLLTPLAHGPDLISGVVGMLGMRWVRAPIPVIIGGLTALLIAFSQADEMQHLPRRGSRRWHAGLVAAAVVGILALMIGFYVTFTPIGWWSVRGLQGRYFIPFVPFIFWGYAFGKESKIKARTKRNYASIITLIIVFNTIATAALYTWAIYGTPPVLLVN